MSTQIRPNQAEISSLILTNFAGKSLDISKVFSRIEIEEDLFSSALNGRISIIESQDFQQTFPLIGEETFSIKFRTYADQPWQNQTFYCYRMSDKIPIGQMMGYTLHFSSTEFVTSRMARVNRPFKSFAPEKIISSVLSTEVGSTKKLFSSKTANNIDIIATNLHPFTFLTSVTSRSKGAKYGDYGYVFFESMDGYHFQTIDELIDTKPIPYILTSRSGVVKEENQLLTINAYMVDENHNVVDRMDDGTYGSEIVVFDPRKRIQKSNNFDYFSDSDYSRLNNVAGQSPKKRIHTSKFKFKDANNRSMMVESGPRSDGKPLRQARISILNSGFRMRVEVPGNSELHVGNTIDLSWPSHSGEDINMGIKKEDRFISGKYLNISMMHVIERTSVTNYTCTCEWIKDSFERDFEDHQEKLNKRIQAI